MRRHKRQMIEHVKWRMENPKIPIWMKGMDPWMMRVWRRVERDAQKHHNRWLDYHRMYMPEPIIIGSDFGRDDSITVSQHMRDDTILINPFGPSKVIIGNVDV